ncbi:hypothetical protein GQ53DRAFT_365955 [Thozetella sp. PMI_491]|nr:hypothetical protein GQ53DRAFT_365955 [Thozetella sp. PMI_491]
MSGASAAARHWSDFEICLRWLLALQGRLAAGRVSAWGGAVAYQPQEGRDTTHRLTAHKRGEVNTPTALPFVKDGALHPLLQRRDLPRSLCCLGE